MTKPVLGVCLINEVSEPTVPKIVGEKNKRPIVEAILQEAEAENRNTRLYKRQELYSEVYGNRFKELIRAGTLFGEAGHPLTDNISRQSTIDPKLSSHRILDIGMKDNIVHGRVTGLPNEYGNFFSECINEGMKTAYSLRAIGVLKQEGGKTWVSKPKIVTYDWVIYPSHPNAYQTGIVSESGILLPNRKNILDSKLNSIKSKTTNKLIIESTQYDGCKQINLNLDNKALDYIKEESLEMCDIFDQLAINESSLKLVTGKSGQNWVTFNSGNDKYILSLDRKISSDILDYYGNI